MAEDVTNEQEAGEGQSLGVESLWRAVENVADAPEEDPLLGTTIGGDSSTSKAWPVLDRFRP